MKNLRRFLKWTNSKEGKVVIHRATTLVLAVYTALKSAGVL